MQVSAVDIFIHTVGFCAKKKKTDVFGTLFFLNINFVLDVYFIVYFMTKSYIMQHIFQTKKKNFGCQGLTAKTEINATVKVSQRTVADFLKHFERKLYEVQL